MGMRGLYLFEWLDNEWVEQVSFNFGLAVIGEEAVSKTICFSPIQNDIVGLEARIEPRNELDFIEDYNHLGTQWKKIEPIKIRLGEKSNPIKIELKASGDKVRIDYFKIEVKYLEVPSDTEVSYKV